MNKTDILIIHGTDYKAMTKKLLAAADLAADIGDRKKSVALKPNLVTAHAPSTGATTHAELLAGTIEYLQENGSGRVAELSRLFGVTEPTIRHDLSLLEEVLCCLKVIILDK